MFAANAPTPANTETRADKAHFNLLPRSLEANPLLNQTVVTELTDEGKKLPPPSRTNPVYYALESGGYRGEGHGPADKLPPKPEDITNVLQRALAMNGYLPSDAAHPPSLFIVYFWGAHTDLDRTTGDPEESRDPDVGHQHLLTRASLVGGTKFARELREVLAKQDLEDQTNRTLDPAMAQMVYNLGPLRFFTQRDTKTLQLWDATCGECYYTVASAYDYAAAREGRRQLLWRTRMTVDSRNVAMRDTLPGLIVAAGKYFGVDMPEAATIAKHVREMRVEIGPLEFGEYLDRVPPPAKDAPGAKNP